MPMTAAPASTATAALDGPDLQQLVKQARAAADFLKALAHENRLLVLCLLCERERSVTEIEQLLSLSQPTVSQQLARLRYDGLVETRREGRGIIYRLADESTKPVIQALCAKFCAD
jgi:DNA-binding transcriptional ArsR family regulator